MKKGELNSFLSPTFPHTTSKRGHNHFLSLVSYLNCQEGRQFFCCFSLFFPYSLLLIYLLIHCFFVFFFAKKRRIVENVIMQRSPSPPFWWRQRHDITHVEQGFWQPAQKAERMKWLRLVPLTMISSLYPSIQFASGLCMSVLMICAVIFGA